MKTILSYKGGEPKPCTVLRRYEGKPETSEHSFRPIRGAWMDYVQVLWGDAEWTTSNYSAGHLLAEHLTGELPPIGYELAEVAQAVCEANKKSLWNKGLTAKEVLAHA